MWCDYIRCIIYIRLSISVEFIMFSKFGLLLPFSIISDVFVTYNDQCSFLSLSYIFCFYFKLFIALASHYICNPNNEILIIVENEEWEEKKPCPPWTKNSFAS